MVVEIWPGIGASKRKVFNENPDVIKIDSKITIARYLKNRNVEDVRGEEYSAKPFEYDFLVKIAKKMYSLKSFFDKMIKTVDPILCDAYCESLEDINFTAIQKTENLNNISFGEEIKNFCIIKSLEDLKKYDGSKELFFDISLSRTNDDWPKIISILKKFKKIYLKSLTMHLAIVLREFGVQVEKGSIKEDYDIREIPLM